MSAALGLVKAKLGEVLDLIEAIEVQQPANEAGYTPEPDAHEQDPVNEAGATFAEVQGLVTAIYNTHGRDRCQKFLAEFGVARASELKESQLADAVARGNLILRGGV
jgi:hypothetical protein